ncbi:helix-turn-helix domain-containing protein [Actinobacillus pleuropneumoniae]|uniref:helix-turn-helix domain-containing protein n=1 Tax=Actinobacillus pleuropneumoniae TaxID=715 RepID=UPI001F27400F|nr:transcriptional regulator [Actinobacillus pleuropneumoniae]UKH19843.1 transcriptional regulator [Actinobacillus pleuropneumoniae]UKH21685.1 transcriptional regulator [Actinobacillus pleuropneumoniae]UPA21422.1 transcriptional regulator [Actinobacillus pleuropneumoniae]UPA21661.1 transcriptional regulator [Actinobacillus pleuropneumoniae]
MSTLNNDKKTAKDWHRADIIAALHKAGWTLRQLSFQHGYSQGSTLKNALDRPWKKGERIIAEAIGVPAEEIWAERFEQRNQKKFANRTL